MLALSRRYWLIPTDIKVGARNLYNVYMALTTGYTFTYNTIDFAHVHFCTLLYPFELICDLLKTHTCDF